MLYCSSYPKDVPRFITVRSIDEPSPRSTVCDIPDFK